MTDKDPNKCICRGMGTYQYLGELDMSVYYLDSNDIHQIQPIPIKTINCPWHSKEGREAVQYPEGWEPEEIRQWCKGANVPEPEWLEPEVVSWTPCAPALEALNKDAIDEWIKSATKILDNLFPLTGYIHSKYPGGVTITENLQYKSVAADLDKSKKKC